MEDHTSMIGNLRDSDLLVIPGNEKKILFCFFGRERKLIYSFSPPQLIRSFQDLKRRFDRLMYYQLGFFGIGVVVGLLLYKFHPQGNSGQLLLPSMSIVIVPKIPYLNDKFNPLIFQIPEGHDESKRRNLIISPIPNISKCIYIRGNKLENYLLSLCLLVSLSFQLKEGEREKKNIKSNTDLLISKLSPIYRKQINFVLYR